MAEPKTKRTDRSVRQFVKTIEDPKRREDCEAVIDLMREVTGEEPAMWGDSIIGFGQYHYKYASGREGDWPLTGVSPRKRSLTLYIMTGFDRFDALMGRLGTFKTGSSCLYINKLEDVDLPTLRRLVAESVAHMKKANP